MKVYSVEIGEDTMIVLSDKSRGDAIAQAVEAYRINNDLPSSYDVIRLYRGCVQLRGVS